jgi:hypothetical protein
LFNFLNKPGFYNNCNPGLSSVELPQSAYPAETLQRQFFQKSLILKEKNIMLTRPASLKGLKNRLIFKI